MQHHNVETASIFKWVLDSASRMGWYARYCKHRGLSYAAFVQELETARREILKTPDGIAMDPETNEALDMVSITAAWRALNTRQLRYLYLLK